MAMTYKHTLILSLISTFFLLNSAISETEILLQFKSSIEDPMNILSTWSNKTTIHHCNWTGISCTNEAPFLVTSLNLQSLNLSGEISVSICNLSKISHINLADNVFNLPIPLHLSQCSYLETLNLSNNLIWGKIPEEISLFKSVKVLDLGRNHIEGEIPEAIGFLKQIEVLNLGNNLISGNVPLIFGNFTELVILDLSHNPFLVSEIPLNIGEMSKVEQILLQSSSFYGEIPVNFFEGFKGLSILDLSQNNLSGEIPKIGTFLPNLVSFDVSQNKFFGSFPNGVCEAKGLISLSLHNNFLNGTISNDSVDKCTNLERFEVQNNGFSGNFPSLVWSLPKVKLIRAENNRFTGEIPDSISEATQLEQVQIDNNSFTGNFPQGIGKLRGLYRFSASSNSLYSELPPNFCDSSVMSIINLSQNYFSGEIPQVKHCRKLVLLALADNNFVGEIPESLADLPVLTYLDLSHNNLTGSIPVELERLKLALFNVSFNKLSGRVPSALVSGLPASFLQGNPDLCGPGLPKPCLGDNNTPMNKPSSFAKLTIALVFIAIAFAILIFAFGFYLIRSNKKKMELGTWRSVFFYPLRVTEHDLTMAMDEKAARGNGGNFGRVYIVNLPSGELVAVKKFLNFASQSYKALKNEVKTLAKIRHKNIAKILGFCYCDESMFLIYEYLPKGSLGDLISSPHFDLSWNARLKIAIGIARGLAYLHKDYVPRLLHRNMKSNNILLDANFQPKLVHFALDRVLGESVFQSTITSSSSSSSSCYLAPEYGYTKKATEQNDTYSYGVILLELLTGRKAEKNEVEVDVVKWVRRKINIKNGPMEVLDPKVSSPSTQEQMLGALELALCCTCVSQEKRPSMCEVVRILQSLESIRTRLLEVSDLC